VKIPCIKKECKEEIYINDIPKYFNPGKEREAIEEKLLGIYLSTRADV